MAQLNKTVMGLAIASNKTIAGLALASNKTIMGLDSTAGGAGIAVVNTAKTRSVNAGTTSALGTNGANLIVVTISCYLGPATLSDNYGNTYTALTRRATPTNAYSAQIFYCANPTVDPNGTPAHTFTYGGTTAQYFTLGVYAVSGANSSPFDVENGNIDNSVAGTTIQPGSVTPSANGAMLITVGGAALNGTASTINSGFTYTSDGFDGTGTCSAQGYLIQSTAGAVNPTFTSGGFVGSPAAAAIAVFKAA